MYEFGSNAENVEATYSLLVYCCCLSKQGPEDRVSHAQEIRAQFTIY
jgi:hypothetical protein